MSTSTLFRLSGLAGLLSGPFLIIGLVSPVGLIWDTIALLSAVLGMFALTGIYLWQREESGSLGGIGYIVASFGIALVVGESFAFTYVLSFLSDSVLEELFAGPTGTAFLVAGVIYLLGVILFGIATFQAGVFPRVAAVLFVVGFVPVSLPPFFPEIVIDIGAVVAGAGIIWFGYVLWSGAGETVEQVEAVT